MMAFTSATLLVLLVDATFGCSLIKPEGPVFGSGLSLGPNEGEWEINVDSTHIAGSDVSGNFFYDINSGASFPTFMLTGDQVLRERPLRPNFDGQYFKIEEHGDWMRIFEAEDVVLGEYLLPWAPRRDGETVELFRLPFSTGYWSSASRKQVYVLVQTDRFGPSVLHIFDTEDGAWLEPVDFEARFGDQGLWKQLKSLDEFGIVETHIPCCACSTVEYVTFDTDGNTKAITEDPIKGDFGFDKYGNLLKVEFGKIFIFRAPALKQTIVTFTADDMRAALEGPVECLDVDCPGIFRPAPCGFEGRKLKFAGANKIRIDGKHNSCGCSSICFDRNSSFWTLKSTDGRCTCYSGGKIKKVIASEGYISSHGDLE